MERSTQRKLRLALWMPVTAALLLGTTAPAAPGVPLKMGMNAGGVDALINAGLKPDYAMVWVGPWMEKYGWGGFDRTLDALYARGVTPAIQFYYWGADTKVECIEHGCWSSSNQVWKSRAKWETLARDLGQHLQDHMKGRTAVIVLETEFNKGSVATYEPFDGDLAQMATLLRNSYSGAQVVLGFGNWAEWNWGVFDRAAAASHMTGVQGMRASTRDTVESYRNVVPALVKAVQTLSAKFGKPVLVTDVALGSYTEPSWLEHQRATVKALMDRRAELRNAGAVGIVYRALYDAPGANTAEYYGVAERTFGLAWAYNRTWKPAMHEWAVGVRAEWAGLSAPTTTTSAPTTTSSTSSLPTLSTEAERFSQRTAGGLRSMSGASGGYVWNLWSNGYIGQSFPTGASTYDVTVRAVGTTFGGIAPIMKVEVDGREVLRETVPAGSLREFHASVPLASGWHQVRVHFLNDAYHGGEDRNLLLDVVRLVPR